MQYSPSFLLTLLGFILGCGDASTGDRASRANDENLGGYTGLGQYTQVAGVYGRGEPASDGGSGTGGASLTPTTGVSPQGGSSTIASSGSSGGTSGSNTVNSSTGGTTGGSSTVNSNTGGTTGGASTAGSSTSSTTNSVWTGDYDPNGTARVTSGRHNPGTNCMTSACHAPTQAGRAFAFGGTVYLSDGSTPAAHVELAIQTSTATYTTYSADNGNFWLPLASATGIDFSSARVHLRNARGELTKPADASVTAGCNSCHGSAMRITSP